MEDKEISLKACPLCGDDDVTIIPTTVMVRGEETEKYYVVCCNCEAQTRAFGTMEQAVKAWNERRGDDGLQNTLNDLREALRINALKLKDADAAAHEANPVARWCFGNTSIAQNGQGLVDVVHDLNVHPWPVESGSVEAAKAWHIVEHIPPVCVTETGARLDIETPYGASAGFFHDPTHCNPCDEVTFEHFDPDYRGLVIVGFVGGSRRGSLILAAQKAHGAGHNTLRYLTYQPKPWRIVSLHWTSDGNVNVVLEKRAEG